MNYALIKTDASAVVTLNTQAPALEFLQKSVGGYIETVPYFDTYDHGGRLWPCVAFCNEEGKLHGLPFNVEATILWVGAMARHGMNNNTDALVGNVIVIFGERHELDTL